MTNNDPKNIMYATTSQLAYNTNKRECKYYKYNFPPRKAQKNAKHLQQVLASSSSSNGGNKTDEIKSCLKQITKDIFYESTTTAAQKYAQTQLLLKQQEQPKINNLGHIVNDKHAITFWSEQKVKQDQQSIFSASSCTNMMFARCSAFTNDIRDGKLRHSEATDEHISHNNS